MTDKELRRMGRAELLEMYLKEREENESLQTRLTASTTELLEKNNQLAAMEDEVREAVRAKEEAEAEVASKRLMCSEAGSIAEASLRVNGIYEAAQAAADQYLENVRMKFADTDAIIAQREADSKEKIQHMLASTKEMCEAKQREADAYYEKKTREADERHDAVLNATKTEVEQYWNSLSTRLEEFYDAHSGMREVLSFYNMNLPVFNFKAEGEQHE